MKNPFHEMFPDSRTVTAVRQQTEAMRSILRQMEHAPGIKPSRSAARSLAESLILEGSEDEARKRVLGDPVGTLSLMSLVTGWLRGQSSAASELQLEPLVDYRPFGILANWFLATLETLEGKWLPECTAQDDYGFAE
jgi:hypothetical protein